VRAEHASARFSRSDRSIIAAAAISMLVVQMDWFALNLALPAIARDFGVPATDLQWVVSGYMLAIGALMITAGKLADVFGRKRTILLGLVVFGTLSAICGAAADETWLIAARVVQGVGAALIFPVAIAVVAAAFSDDRQARAISVVLAFSAVGMALGPFVGGAFSEHLSWRWVFFVNVPFCLAASVLMLRFAPESRDETAPHRIDVPGVLLVSGGLVAIAYAVDKGQDWGWTSAATLGLLAAGTVLLLAFVAVEKRVRAPLVDLALFRNRPFVAVTCAGTISNVVFCLVAVFSALYLQQARGLSPLDAGVVFLALSGGAALASLASGPLSERYDPARVMAVGMIVAAVALFGLTYLTSLWVYTPVFFVCGVGVGLGWTLTNVAVQASVPPETAGAASGVALTSLVLLGAIGVAIGTTVLELVSGSPSRAAADAEAIDVVLRAGAVLGLLGAIGLAVFGTRRATAPGRGQRVAVRIAQRSS
jgi:EmrB/QacA subfamily drug resistance transporter